MKNKKLVIGLIIGTLFAGQTFAYFWQNPVNKYLDTNKTFIEWESQGASQERALFYDHCSALEWKQENNEEIKDNRYTKTCEDNDIKLYLKIRRGFPKAQ